jgi:hypothetical protein
MIIFEYMYHNWVWSTVVLVFEADKGTHLLVEEGPDPVEMRQALL